MVEFIEEKHYKFAIKLSRALIKKYIDQINKINVFPVPDGDTGTNLFLTLDGIWKRVKRVKYNHFGKFSEKVAEAAFEAAQGNSGNILASFLYGIYDYAKDKRYVKVEELVYAFENGTKYAYEAVENPIEGTILTAMRISTEVARNELRNGNRDLKKILERSIKEAYRHLKSYRDLVPQLKEYKVIDAGGLGFIIILRAWARGTSHQLKIDVSKRAIQVKYSGGYCINILVKVEESKIEKIKKALSKIGTSIVFQRYRDLVKIHIHSDNIDEVVNTIAKYGRIVKTNVSRI